MFAVYLAMDNLGAWIWYHTITHDPNKRVSNLRRVLHARYLRAVRAIAFDSIDEIATLRISECDHRPRELCSLTICGRKLPFVLDGLLLALRGQNGDLRTAIGCFKRYARLTWLR